MISYPVYKIVHLLGIFLLIVALGGISIHAANGGTRSESTTRRLTAILHGLGALIILVSGFGLLARLGITGGLPAWIWAKLVIWLLLSAAIALPYRRPDWGKPLAVILPLLAVLAAYFALFKPF